MNQQSISHLPDLDEVYKNLLTCFDPASKRLVQAGRDLLRAWLVVADATKSYAEALDRLGAAGSMCGGETREIGQCLLQISDALKELNKHEKTTIGFYESQVLAPTEANLDQDSKVIVEERKKFEKKQKIMFERVKRDKKKGVPTEESERMLRDYQDDCVKQALTEEKKRYTYMLDRHCALATWQLQFHRTALSLYEQNIQKWKEACANPEELSAAALAALDAAIQPYATQSSIALSTVSRGGIQSLANTETDTISNSLPPTPTVREQGVGTFHINEGESVKATLDAATVLLHNQQQQQKQDSLNKKNGHTELVNRQLDPKTYADPPSTGSSTLSNGSRYATASELTQQKKAASVSSLVVMKNSPNLSTSQKQMQENNVEYAVAIKPQKQPVALVKTEQVNKSPNVIRNSTLEASPNLERQRVVAMFTYNNPGSNQLTFQEGDAILVIQQGQQGWQFGENVSTGKRGWYPASFTKKGDVNPSSYENRPRANSSSTSRNIETVTDNGGHNGYNGIGYNGNGLKHSPPALNGDGVADKTSLKSNGRPISMMVLQSNNSPSYRPAPPPPVQGAPPTYEPSDDDPIVYLDDNQEKDLHAVNYDTVPKHNPFAHVRLRKVVKTDGTPKKYG